MANNRPMLCFRQRLCLLFAILLVSASSSNAQVFVELNCENLFDTQHDDGKEDYEFLVDGQRHWTRTRY